MSSYLNELRKSNICFSLQIRFNHTERGEPIDGITHNHFRKVSLIEICFLEMPLGLVNSYFVYTTCFLEVPLGSVNSYFVYTVALY